MAGGLTEQQLQTMVNSVSYLDPKTRRTILFSVMLALGETATRADESGPAVLSSAEGVDATYVDLDRLAVVDPVLLRQLYELIRTRRLQLDEVQAGGPA